MQRITFKAIIVRAERSFSHSSQKKPYRVPRCTRTSPLPLLPSGPGGIGGIASRGTRRFNSNILFPAWVSHTTDDSGRCRDGSPAASERTNPSQGNASAVWSVAISEIKSGRGPGRRAPTQGGQTQPTSSFCKRFGAKRQDSSYVRSPARGLRFAPALNSGRIR